MRILIIRACAIGDFVLNLPALRALACANSEARFTLVGYPDTLALARTFIPVEAIHSIEGPPWSNLFSGPIDDLSSFDRACVWMKDSTIADNLRASGVREILHAHAFPQTLHAAEHLLRTVDLPAPDLPDLWNPNSTRIIFHPGSGGASKVWPHFEELAQEFPEATILLGPCEKPLRANNPSLQNRSLQQVAEELRNCRIFVGNDSGITHIAAYWGTPTVALFGPTDSRVWGPVGRRVKILEKPTVDDVRKLL